MFKTYQIESEAEGNVNNVIIIDRSGSMYHTLPGLIDDVIGMVPKFKNGDTLSVAWFSSEGGQFDWLVKAHVITEKSAQFIADLLSKYKRTVAMTCFSEVLESLAEVLNTVETFNPTNVFTFLSDGHPVVSNVRKEEMDTLKTLQNLAPRLSSALFIGYGSYYNKPFMAQMAEAVGGTLIHASEPQDVTISLSDFVKLANPMVAVDLTTGQAFYITNQGVYNAKREADKVYVPSGVKELHYAAENGEDSVEVLLAYAYLQMTNNQADEAIQTLGKVGDVRLIDIVSNAFTNEEYGKAQAAILEAVRDEKSRFVKGKNTNYLPKPDAYCLVQMLEELSEQVGVFFLPRHPHFKYNRTGVKRTTREGYPEFVEYPDPTVPLNTLVWHGSRANVSVQATIPGEVDLGPEAKLYGLPNPFPCVQIRNYTIVKDGVLNVAALPLDIPPEIAQELDVMGKYLGEDTYVLDLTSIPIINKNIADTYVGSVHDYLNLAEEELVLEAGQKVYNHYYNLLNPTKVDAAEPWNEQQQIFLKSKGITKGIYSPPSDSDGFEDVYLAKEVLLKKAGFSQKPKVVDVQAAIVSNKKLNGPGQLMRPFVEQAMALSVEQLAERQKSIRRDLRALRKPMQRTLFGIVVGNKWFKDLTERDGAWVGEWNVSLKETEVKF